MTTESASFLAFPSSRILLFPEPHVESETSAGKTVDGVARFALFVPFFLVSLEFFKPRLSSYIFLFLCTAFIFIFSFIFIFLRVLLLIFFESTQYPSGHRILCERVC